MPRLLQHGYLGVPQTYLGDHAKANERLQWTIDHYPAASRRRDMIRLGGDPRASALAHRTINLLSLGSSRYRVKEIKNCCRRSA